MTTKLLKNVAVIFVFSALAVMSLNAQSRNDVIAAYNEGAKAVSTDAVAAIAAFEKAITIAEKVGADAADLSDKATKILPGLYIKVAAAAVNEKKPVPEVMKAAKAAVAISEKYGTAASKDNAAKIMVLAYNAQAAAYFSQNDFQNALATFDSILAINPGYVNAIYNKSLIYIRQNNPEAYGQTIDLYIEKLKAVNDTIKIKQASTQALEYFRSAGSKANQAGKLDDALVSLTSAAKYGNDKDLFYYFADVYNKKKNFDSGAEYAKRGLDLETGAAEAKAKFYFQLGLAQAGKGQTTYACASFKNAVYGQFAEPSKVQLKNLKCQ